MSAATKQHVVQPTHFAFTPENLAVANAHIAKYPQDRTQVAIIGTLDVVFGEIDR